MTLYHSKKKVPRSDIQTKFMNRSSFRQVFESFFDVIFTQDKEIVRFHYILLNLCLKTKYTVKPLFFNPFFIAGFC